MQDETNWIQGDGGPLIVLQATAAAQWPGARDFADSLMNRDSVETDYDVICACEDGVSVIERYGRQMLVLSDSSWAGCFVPSPTAEVVIVQWFGGDDGMDELVSRLTTAANKKTLAFTVCDTALRLLVGADSGDGQNYGFSKVAVTPGLKVCEVYSSDEAQVVVLRSVGADAA